MVDSERVVNEALARLYAFGLRNLSSSQQRNFDAFRGGAYEIDGLDGIKFDGDIVVRTKLTGYLVRIKSALDAFSHLAEIVTNWDHAERVYSNYLSERTLSGEEYESPDFGAHAVIFREGVDLLLKGDSLDTVLLAGASSPNSIRQALAFLEIYNPNNVIVGDNDPFLFELCKEDGLDVSTCLCDFTNKDSMPEYDIAINGNTLTYVSRTHKGRSLFYNEGLATKMIPMSLNLVRKAKKGVVFTEYINLNVVLSRLGRNFAEEGIEVLGTREIIPTFSRGLSYDELRMESYQNIPMQDNMGTCCILGRK